MSEQRTAAPDSSAFSAVGGAMPDAVAQSPPLEHTPEDTPVQLYREHTSPSSALNLNSSSSHIAREGDRAAQPSRVFRDNRASEESANTAEQLAASESLVSSPSAVEAMGQLFARQTPNQGTQIRINDRVVSGRWLRHDHQIYLDESTLMQSLGLDLLSSDDPSSQPVQWFSNESTSPLSLATVFDGQRRFLNLSALAQTHDWQVIAQANNVAIATPSSQVLGVRHGKQVWGDRLVLDLTQSAPFQTRLGNGSVSVTVDASLAATLPLPASDMTHTLSSASLTPQGSQTRLDLQFSSSHQARVWTVPSPPRLIIDIHPGFTESKRIQWQPGVWWQQGVMNLGSSQFPVVFLEIDPSRPNISLKPIWTNPSAMPGIAPLATTAQAWQAAAAINAGFFNRNNQLPLGAIRRDREWISGPILNRGAIAWNRPHELSVGRLALRETIRLDSGQVFPSLHLNSGYVQAGLSRYTPLWGRSYTPLTDYETLITIRNGRVAAKQRIESAGSAHVPIPLDGYVLAARSFQTAADAMPIGSTLQPESTSIPPIFDQYSHVVGAGPLLLQNRQIVLNAELEGFSSAFARQGAARSAIAKTQSGTLLMLTVMRRVSGSGPTLSELAQILYQMGATDALNLDGGNSTSLFLGGQLINRPSTTAARVHNGIGLFIQP